MQDVLERALGAFANQPLRTNCAGRTDAGVHALMQVVHFDTSAQRSEAAWVRGVNAQLPPGVAVQWARAVSQRFHCRACANSRRYAYVVLESAVRPSLERHRVGWVFRPLNLSAMQQAAALLIGEHDFSAFRASQCQALSPIKHLQRIAITQRGPYWRFDFEANAFLHHMIRNLMGCLLAVGQGRRPPEWVAQVLASRKREAAAPTFAAAGLYFLGPRYAPSWDLPERTVPFDSLPVPAAD